MERGIVIRRAEPAAVRAAIWIQGVAADAAWIVVVDKLPATVFNGAVAVIFAPVLAITIHKALKKNHLTLN